MSGIEAGPSPRSFLVGLIGLVVNDQEEILILEYSQRRRFPRGLPSGWLGPGERVVDSLRLLINEQTGFEVSFEQILSVRSRVEPRRVDVWIKCRLEGGSFRPSPEVRGAGFHRLRDLPELPPEQWTFVARNREPIFGPAKASRATTFHSTVSALLLNGDKVLLIRENYGQRRYGLPGGVVDEGEDPAEALEREVMEEIGVKIRPLYLVGMYLTQEFEPEPHSVHFAFRCEIEEGVPGPPETGEIAEVGWFDSGDLPEPLTNLGPRVVSDALANERGVVRRFVRMPDRSLAPSDAS